MFHLNKAEKFNAIAWYKKSERFAFFIERICLLLKIMLSYTCKNRNVKFDIRCRFADFIVSAIQPEDESTFWFYKHQIILQKKS